MEDAGALIGGRVCVLEKIEISAGVPRREGGTAMNRPVCAEMLTGRDTCGISTETQILDLIHH